MFFHNLKNTYFKSQKRIKRSYQCYILRNLQSDLFQVDAFHKSGMSGPTLGVAKYDRSLTFRLIISELNIFCTEYLVFNINCFNYYDLIVIVDNSKRSCTSS